jgi:hypothetical protein
LTATKKPLPGKWVQTDSAAMSFFRCPASAFKRQHNAGHGEQDTDSVLFAPNAKQEKAAAPRQHRIARQAG